MLELRLVRRDQDRRLAPATAGGTDAHGRQRHHATQEASEGEAV
jgi:hypothetical protein